MDRIFLDLLNMSLVGAFVIGVICLARLPLKRAPKIISYCLWIVAGIRLLVPFSIESGFGLVPDVQPIPQQVQVEIFGTFFSPIMLNRPVPVHQDFSAYAGENAPRLLEYPLGYGEIVVYDNFAPQGWSFSQILQSLQSFQNWTSIVMVIWLVGVVVMLVYGAMSYVRLKRAMGGAILLDSNVYKADNIRTPFVLGILFPKIYLPADLPPHAHEYVLLHEMTHIRRYDYIVRFVAYLALCVHWFNPMVWLAFRLMGADMEMSCDERVLKELGRDIRKDYSLTLVSMAVTDNIVANPLAFSRGDINRRVKNVLDFKKRSLLAVILAVVLTTALGAGLLVNRTSASAEASEPSQVIAEEWVTDDWRGWQRDQIIAENPELHFVEYYSFMMRASEAYWVVVNDTIIQLQYRPSLGYVPPSRVEIPFVGRLAEVDEWVEENGIEVEIMDFYRDIFPEYLSLDYFEPDDIPDGLTFEPHAMQFAVLFLFDENGLHTESLVRNAAVDWETGLNRINAGDEVRYIDTWGNLWRMGISDLSHEVPKPWDLEVADGERPARPIPVPMPPEYFPCIEITIHGGLRRMERIWVHGQLDLSAVVSAEVSFVGTLDEIRSWEASSGITGILNSRYLNPQVPENTILLAIDLLDANQNVVGRLLEHNVYPAIYRGLSAYNHG